MEITTMYQGPNAILRLSGDILGDDRLKLYETIQEQLEKGYTQLVLNFEKVNLMDSVGLGVLIAAHTSLSRAGAELALSNIGRSVNYLFTIAKLNQVFKRYDTEDEALSSFQS